MGTRTILLVVTGCLLLAAPAQADETPNEVPAGYVYADRLLREAVVVADLRWLRRGYAPRCRAEVFVYDEPNSMAALARGELGGCKVYFDRAYRDRVWREYTDARVPRVDRRPVLAYLAAVATHERGHNLGFLHEAGGVMATPPLIPWLAKRWAAWKLPVHGPPR